MIVAPVVPVVAPSIVVAVVGVPVAVVVVVVIIIVVAIPTAPAEFAGVPVPFFEFVVVELDVRGAASAAGFASAFRVKIPANAGAVIHLWRFQPGAVAEAEYFPVLVVGETATLGLERVLDFGGVCRIGEGCRWDGESDPLHLNIEEEVLEIKEVTVHIFDSVDGLAEEEADT